LRGQSKASPIKFNVDFYLNFGRTPGAFKSGQDDRAPTMTLFKFEKVLLYLSVSILFFIPVNFLVFIRVYPCSSAAKNCFPYLQQRQVYQFDLW